jgi:membrane fusion protein, peptide pheromone/bacteriocin exporter
MNPYLLNNDEPLPQIMPHDMQRGVIIRYGVYMTSVFLICGFILITAIFSLHIKITGMGTLQSTDAYFRVLSPFSGEINEVFVQENEFVQKGQAIMQFDTNDLEIEIKKIKNDQKQILNQIVDLNTLVLENQQDQQLQLDKYQSERALTSRRLLLVDLEIAAEEKRCERNKKLFELSLISNESFENQADELEQLRLKKEQFIFEKKLEYQSERRMLLDKLEELRKETCLLIDLKRKRTIAANTSGHLISLNVVSSKTYVNIGQQLFCISPDSHLNAIIFIAAKDVALVHQNQEIRYRIEALPYQEWGYGRGHVLSVSDDIIIDEKGRSGFKVIGSINGNSIYSKRIQRKIPIKKGMILQSSIILGKKKIIDYIVCGIKSKFLL